MENDKFLHEISRVYQYYGVTSAVLLWTVWILNSKTCRSNSFNKTTDTLAYILVWYNVQIHSPLLSSGLSGNRIWNSTLDNPADKTQRSETSWAPRLASE